MKILADTYLYKLEEIIPENVQLSRFDPEAGFPNDAPKFDALLIRTVTKIDRRTLPNPGNLKFIGSATAGFDHVDLDYLDEAGIAFANSAGCNSRAVAEFVITGLYRWGDLRNINPEDLNIGVVGCGNTGGQLINLLNRLGIKNVKYDPPKQKRVTDFESAGLEELLRCDVLSFHTPLTVKGEHATRHMCNSSWLENHFQLIINTARGGVVDEKSLLKAMAIGNVDDAILDVWEGEPVFGDDMAKKTLIATPHIAGYSREAKWRASEMVVSQLCDFFDLDYHPKEITEQFSVDKLSASAEMSFSDFMWKNNRVEYYDKKLRKLIGLPEQKKAEKFAALRSQTKTRFEYRSVLKTAEESGSPVPEKAGFFL